MSETFTKGKWEVAIEELRNSKREVFTVVTDDFDVVSSDLCIRNEKDAHLIAAAPEMYAMLERDVEMIRKYIKSSREIEGGVLHMELIRKEKLLAKARGEQQ